MKRKHVIVTLILIISGFMFFSCDDSLSNPISLGRLEGTTWAYKKGLGVSGTAGVVEIISFNTYSNGTAIKIDNNNESYEPITYTVSFFSSLVYKGEITYEDLSKENFELTYRFGKYYITVNPGDGILEREYIQIK